jgi:hypothetical protein
MHFPMLNRCNMQKSHRHFLDDKIQIVCLISVYGDKTSIVPANSLWNLFSITKNIVFSSVWSWCTKPKWKHEKTILKNGKHRNYAHRTNPPVFRLAFNENDRSITYFSMWIWSGHLHIAALSPSSEYIERKAHKKGMKLHWCGRT